MGRPTHRVGVDVGGTFTDLVALTDDGIVTSKVPSTPGDQSVGVLDGIREAAIEPSRVKVVSHGTTVATNALLERKGGRTALITTEGFRDVIEIGRQDRPALYDLTRDRPEALVPRGLRFTVVERMGPDGEINPLDQSSVERAVSALEQEGVDAVAVCLLFSFLHPEHEQSIGRMLRRRLSNVHISLSSEVIPELREYERTATTVADAYLAPRLASYLRALGDKLQREGLPAPLVMQSSGGLIDIDTAARRAATCVLSGPAGGVVGAAFIGARSGFKDVLTFDMGGTSTDVASAIGGRVATTTESEVAGVPIRFPMVDVHTVSAGGGSVAWVDEGGVLRVGPRSAGADPGPASYDLGGDEVTVTDANLLLGYLPDEARLGGSVRLKRELAEKAAARLAGELGMNDREIAVGVVEVANAEMARALRFISIERGLDPRDFGLVAFGGAGPMHACALADELGISRVLVPKASGMLSALGLAMSELRRDYVTSWPARLAETDPEDLKAAFGPLEERARADLDSPRLVRRADLRYAGQSFELTVAADHPDDLGGLFHDAHERRYGYRMEAEPVEVVALRLVATVRHEDIELREGRAEGDPVRSTRHAFFDGSWTDVAVIDRMKMGAGSEVTGPCIVELAGSTCVVRPQWHGAIDDSGTLILEQT
jgi:N-methylhydantoinase A